MSRFGRAKFEIGLTERGCCMAGPAVGVRGMENRSKNRKFQRSKFASITFFLSVRDRKSVKFCTNRCWSGPEKNYRCRDLAGPSLKLVSQREVTVWLADGPFRFECLSPTSSGKNTLAMAVMTGKQKVCVPAYGLLCRFSLMQRATLYHL